MPCRPEALDALIDETHIYRAAISEDKVMDLFVSGPAGGTIIEL